MEVDAATAPQTEGEAEAPSQAQTTSLPEGLTNSADGADAEKLTNDSTHVQNGEKQELGKNEEAKPKVHVSAHVKDRAENASERVEEGRRWNERDRNRPRRDNYPNKKFKSNNRSDLTSQEESSDPAAIRKQVRLQMSALGQILLTQGQG